MLGWKAQTFGDDLVNLMVDGDIAAVESEMSGHSIRIDR